MLSSVLLLGCWEQGLFKENPGGPASADTALQ